jgi:hypothetical protein
LTYIKSEQKIPKLDSHPIFFFNSRSISSVGEGSLSSKSKLGRGRNKRLLPNYFGHLVKTWRDVGGGVSLGDDRDACDDIEMEVPVQLLQLPSHEGERTNRKDLSKFLGLDDSDGEEIVFIQTKPPQNFRRLNNNGGGGNNYNNNICAEDVFGFDDRSLSKCRSFSSSSLRLTNSDGHNTIDKFLRTSIRRNQQKQQQHVPDWLGSLGKASLKRVLRSAKDLEARDSDSDGRSEDFDPPPRKSVLFKEYAFSVQESIATGLPIIPFACPPTSTFGERKRKKDAAKRTAEVMSLKKPPTLPALPPNPPGTSLEALLRIANEEWLKENSEDSSTMLDTSIDASEASSSFASTVKTGLVTLDRKSQQQQRQQAPSRQAVHPRVLEASKMCATPKPAITSPSASSHFGASGANPSGNGSDGGGKKSNVQRSTVVFGPTSHRWIPRRETYPEVMVPYPAPFLCRPAQFYAAMPVPMPQSYMPGMPPRMAVYPDSGRVKMVRRNPARQMFPAADYVDMRQGRLLKSVMPNDDFEP